MAYQDDFRNKVLAALKAKNLAVDISQEATQQAIVEEVQNVAKSEARPMSAAEMKQVLQDVSKELSTEKKQFTAQSSDFIAFNDMLEGPLTEGEGSYSGGGIAVSVANKDIIIIPSNGGLGAAGSATSVNSISQIDFKYIANPNAYATFDPREVKASLFNWGERVPGNTYDTPVLGIGGAWNGISYAPTPQWGVGNSFGSGVGGSINQISGFGQIIFFKPASSTIYASLYNDVAISSNFDGKYLSIIGYQSAVPGAFPTAGFAVSFGGIGNSGPLTIGGAASASQSNRVRFLSSLTISNSTATDTLTLGLSSATGSTQNFVGGGVIQYNLSTTTSSFAQGDLFYASGTGHVTLTKLAIGGNNTYLTSNGSVPSWTSSISANTVAVNAATGSTILFPLLNNIAGAGSAVSTDVDFNVDPGANILRYSSGSFYVGTAVSSPIHTSIADVAIKPGANSTTAIQLENLAGQAVLNVDTNNNRVSIGSNVTGGTYTLDVSGDTNISTGSVYRINGTSVLSNNTLGTGVVTSSLTALGTVTTGTWSATAITVFYGGTGQVSYAVGDVLFANTTSTLAKLAAVATGSVLASQGVNTAPAYVTTGSLTVGFAGTAYQLRTAQTNVATALYPLFADATSGSIGASIDTDIVYNSSSNILTVPNVYSGTALSSPLFTTSSNVTIKPGVNSTTAIQLDNVAGQAVLNVDTSNNRVSIGSNVTGGAYTLDVSGDANISTGSVYRINGTSVLSNNTLGTGVVTSSLTTVGTIGTGVWQGTAIGTTYGGTGSNLGNNTANANKIPVLGSAANGYAATLIDGANTGQLLAAQGNGSAPSFVNTTTSAFTFSSGTLTINNAAITTGTITGTPTNANDIVNKSYADSISAGLDIHDSARITTLSAIGGSYRQSGTAGTLSGLGDYIIATTPGTLIGADAGWDTVGIALTNGQRVLVKDGVKGGYASGAGAYGAYPTTYGGFANSWVANGVYEVASYGGAATSGWLLVRALDSDNGGGLQELTGGTFLFVEEGANYADHAFVCSNDTQHLGPVGFGSTQIHWTLFAGGNTLIAGQGLAESGNNLALLFNLVQANQISSSNFFSRGFTLGGARAASLGSSSLNTFTVTGVSDTAAATNTFTANADGFSLAGGQTPRTLTLLSSNITLTGGGNTLTLSSSSTLNLNSQTLAITAATSNITFKPFSTTATTHNLVSSGSEQYQLSTADTNFAAGDIYYNTAGSYQAMTRLALGTGAGTSVLIRNGATGPMWGTIALGSDNFVSGTLGINRGGTNGSATPTSGAVAYGNGTAYAFTNAGTAGSVLISNGTNPLFSAVNLASSNAVTGILPIVNGGTNASSFTNTNGAVIFDGTRLVTATGTTITSGVGISVVGTINSSGGFFTGGNSVVTSVGGIYGAVTLLSSASVGGTSFFSVSGQNLVLNYPGTGITGTGAVTQVPYYNAARELTGDVGLVYSRTAASGVGLSLNINASTGTILRVNSAQALTSGLLIDVDNNSTQAFSVDFKGMTSIAAASGNTALIMTGGRTVLAPATSSYASIGFNATGTNPSTPNIGDLWFNGTNLYFRKDGSTNFDLLVGSVSGSGTANKVAKWSSSSALTDSNITDAGVGMTITSTSAVGAGGGSTAVLTLQTVLADNSLTDRYFVRGVTSTGTRLFSVDTAGNLRATTKSFDIPHPTKEGMRLVYGVLEGPEHGVYHRGTVEGKGIIKIELPEYWHKLVGDQYTIQLTPWGNYNVSIDSKTENYFTIQLVGDFISRKFKNIKVDYIVHGSRLDAPLETEQ